jgi:hypothetical protein
MFEPITFQHHEKKILGEILGVLGGMAAPADERKDRPPIEAAEFRERLSGFLIVGPDIGGSEDEAPARGREVARGAAAFCGHTGVHGGR